MKTPIQELIEKLKEERDLHGFVRGLHYETAIELAESMLEKEKEERRKIFSIAYRMIPTEFGKEHCDEQFELFNKTFKTKER